MLKERPRCTCCGRPRTQRLSGTTVPVQDGTGMEICNANCACVNGIQAHNVTVLCPVFSSVVTNTCVCSAVHEECGHVPHMPSTDVRSYMACKLLRACLVQHTCLLLGWSSLATKGIFNCVPHLVVRQAHMHA